MRPGLGIAALVALALLVVSVWWEAYAFSGPFPIFTSRGAGAGGALVRGQVVVGGWWEPGPVSWDPEWGFGRSMCACGGARESAGVGWGWWGGNALSTREVGLLVDLCCADSGLGEIAAQHGVSVEGLARWAGGRVALLERLRELVVLRGTLRTAWARAEAASSLQRLAMDRSNPETARKACVDLLRLRIDVGEVVRAAGGEVEERDEQTLRGVLERLGSEGGGIDGGEDDKATE